jgi:hypothetical protein
MDGKAMFDRFKKKYEDKIDGTKRGWEKILKKGELPSPRALKKAAEDSIKCLKMASMCPTAQMEVVEAEIEEFIMEEVIRATADTLGKDECLGHYTWFCRQFGVKDQGVIEESFDHVWTEIMKRVTGDED